MVPIAYNNYHDTWWFNNLNSLGVRILSIPAGSRYAWAGDAPWRDEPCLQDRRLGGSCASMHPLSLFVGGLQTSNQYVAPMDILLFVNESRPFVPFYDQTYFILQMSTKILRYHDSTGFLDIQVLNDVFTIFVIQHHNHVASTHFHDTSKIHIKFISWVFILQYSCARRYLHCMGILQM